MITREQAEALLSKSNAGLLIMSSMEESFARTILALYAKLDRAREGLCPFAQEHAWGPSDRFEIVLANQYGSITGADLDNARAILKEIGE